jgi:hypothetical protein
MRVLVDWEQRKMAQATASRGCMTIRLLGHPLCDRNRPAFSRQKPRFLPADAQRFSAGLLKAPQASFSLCS